MNKELIEKLSAIREDLRALNDGMVGLNYHQVADVKKLADLVVQKVPTLKNNYWELYRYMILEEGVKAHNHCTVILTFAQLYLERGEMGDQLIEEATRLVSQMLADFDDIERKMKNAAQ